MFFQTYICICIDTFPYLGTKRNEEFLIIHVKKCYSIIIRSYVFTYVCSLVGWKMANTTTIGEKDRFIGRIYSKELTVLINGNRFVSVKKKKKILAAMEREREGRRFFTFVHSYSLRFSPFHKLDRFRVIVQVSPSRLCFNSPPLLALFFTADHCTINPASSVCLCIFHRFRGTVTLLGETPLKFWTDQN